MTIPIKDHLVQNIKRVHPTNISTRRKLDQINNIIIVSIFCHIPNTYEELINSEDINNWIEVINDELNNLYSNNIMTFVNNVPKNKNNHLYKMGFQHCTHNLTIYLIYLFIVFIYIYVYLFIYI